MNLRHVLSFLFTSITAGLAAALVFLVLRPDIQTHLGKSADQERPPATAVLPANSAMPAQGPVSYADAVSRAAPSVVNIFTAKITTEKISPMVQDPVLQQFFSHLFKGVNRRHIERSLGSGVIVSAQGYVLTNNHIVADVDEIKVILEDGRDVPVVVVGRDPETDLAVLRVDAADLPAIPIGNSDELRVGDVVMAIGNPFGIGQTVTLGIVSATDRSHLGINTIENFIQTDAAINRGNSGGALINARGELIGINTAIVSPTGGSHGIGIGFAIPAALAEGVMQQIILNGRVVRGWLGISAQDVTRKLAESFGLRDTQGILVSGIQEGGPAERAGLQPGDVISVVNGQKPKNSRALFTLISREPPGSTLRILGWRGNNRLDLAATINERPITRD